MNHFEKHHLLSLNRQTFLQLNFFVDPKQMILLWRQYCVYYKMQLETYLNHHLEFYYLSPKQKMAQNRVQNPVPEIAYPD